MGCGCDKRAEGLLGKLGFEELENGTYFFHGPRITVRVGREYIREHHTVISIIGFLLRLFK